MGKLVSFSELERIANKSRKKHKNIVLCHGCFDLMHPGHIWHLQSAKKLGDILLVTVTKDKFVDKGPGRPIFNEKLRGESIAALECVDYVAINLWPTAKETIRRICPTYYVKGQDYDIKSGINEKLKGEIAVLREVGGKLKFTNEKIIFSSTAIFKKVLQHL